MKALMTRIWIFVIAAGALLASSAIRAAAPPRIEARLPASIPVLSPLPIELVFVNTGATELILHDFPRPRLVRVTILRADKTLVHRGFVSPGAGTVGEDFLKPIALRPEGTFVLAVTLANRWTESRVMIGPAFSTPGRFFLSFNYTLTYEADGARDVVEVQSPEVPLEVMATPGADLPAFQGLRAQTHLDWTLEPRVGLRRGSETDLATWEQELRAHLRDFPASPWTPLVQFALASRLADHAARPGNATRTLLTEASRLLVASLSRTNAPYHREALQLQRNLQERSSTPPPGPLVAPTAARSQNPEVEAAFARLIQAVEKGEVGFLQPLLDANFRYNARLNATDWLELIAAEHRALGQAGLKVTTKIVSVDSTPGEATLVSDVTYASGDKRKERRVIAGFRYVNGHWLLMNLSDQRSE
jgi:hypothetical protein